MSRRANKLRRQLRGLHPDWDHRWYDTDGVLAFLWQHYPALGLLCAQLPYAIQVVDLFRLAAIHLLGGFWVDIDVCVHQPLDDLCAHACVFPVEKANSDTLLQAQRERSLLGNYMFGAAAGAWQLAHVLDQLTALAMRPSLYSWALPPFAQAEHIVMHTTGPVALTHAMIGVPCTRLLHPDEGRFGHYAAHEAHGTWKDRSA
jgi:mannosyltransferase OCH1-like enzyme